VSIAFFVLAVLSASSTFFAVVAPRRPLLLGAFSWAFGLLPCELPYAALMGNVLLLVLFGCLGALASAFGVAGSVLIGAAIIGDLVLARRSADARVAVEHALRNALGLRFEQEVDPALAARIRRRVPLSPVIFAPFFSRRRDVVHVADISYGDAGIRNRLDLYIHRSHPRGCPVLIYVHGGGWTRGRKDQQGLPIVYHFASQHWLCVAPNYRLCPDATFPDPLIDIKRVIAWVREHAHEHGGDPGQLFITGGSAGGHLSALAALTVNDPTFQPGFELADTSITAAMPLYGDYDWLDSHGERATRNLDRSEYFTTTILKCSVDDDRRRWEQGSPLYRVWSDAPPFFVVHGVKDSMLLVEDTRHFVDALRAVSREPVAYAELPGAQHGFDGFQSVRCGHVINGMEWFTSWVRSTHLDVSTHPARDATLPSQRDSLSPPPAT
jgi:acetyl esterase/lipase